MDILGVGPFEFLFFLIIALLVLGPEGMIKTTRGIARFIRNIITSPSWRTVRDVQREMQTIPTQLIREAGLENIQEIVPSPQEIAHEAGLDQLQYDVNKIKADMSGWTADAPTIQPVPKPVPPPAPNPPPATASPAANSTGPVALPQPSDPAPTPPKTN